MQFAMHHAHDGCDTCMQYIRSMMAQQQRLGPGYYFFFKKIVTKGGRDISLILKPYSMQFTNNAGTSEKPKKPRT